MYKHSGAVDSEGVIDEAHTESKSFEQVRRRLVFDRNLEVVQLLREDRRKLACHIQYMCNSYERGKSNEKQ